MFELILDFRWSHGLYLNIYIIWMFSIAFVGWHNDTADDEDSIHYLIIPASAKLHWEKIIIW